MRKKTVLITGCSSGIGYETAKHLRRRGYHVLATARKQQDVSRLKKEGFDPFRLDMDDPSSLRSTVKEIEKRKQGLYAVFHNAAQGYPGAIEDLPREAWRRQFETNLFGIAELNTLLIPLFRKQGHGRIIINSSVLGFVSVPFRGAYNASKYALEGYADTLRLELPSYIRLVVVQPGPITSKFRENAYKNFKRFINPLRGAHKKTYRELIRRFENPSIESAFTLPGMAVARKVERALEARSPKVRYRVTLPTHLLAFLKWLLPQKLLDRILRRI